MTRRTPAATAVSSSTRPAVTLLAWYFAGSATDSATRAKAAKCIRASIERPANSASSTGRSPTFPRMNSTPAGTAARCPVLRSSSTIGLSPRARSCSTATLPMYPAPPVTKMLRPIARFQTEQTLERFEETVPPTRAGGFLQRDRGLVQKLVEQRVTELFELGAILGGQMHAAQRPSDLIRPNALHLIAQLFEHRYDGQTTIPGPESLHFLAHNVLGRRDVASPLGGGLGRDRLEIVDIVEEHVLELRHRGIDVAWHREVEDAERPAPAPGDDGCHAIPGHHRVGGRRGAQHDVRVGEVVPRFIQREGARVEIFGDGPGALVRSVGYDRHADALGREARRGELGHVARAEDQGGAPGQVGEDLGGHGDRGGGRRRGPGGQSGLAPHARADEQRRLEQAM